MMVLFEGIWNCGVGWNNVLRKIWLCLVLVRLVWSVVIGGSFVVVVGDSVFIVVCVVIWLWIIVVFVLLILVLLFVIVILVIDDWLFVFSIGD